MRDKTPTKEQMERALMERVDGYESTDKSEFIRELLPLLDPYVLLAVCRMQGVHLEDD